MAYFKYLPKVYVRNRTIQEGNHPYQLTRNIFRRIKIKDHLLGSLLGFTQYSIGEGERPDQVARKFYGDSGLDWMVLIINNIININEDWPMNRQDLYNYTLKHYGDVDQISHYESIEIFATTGEKVLDEGMVVNENFQYVRSDGTVVPKEDCRRAVTYFEIEQKKNEQKRNIYLIREEYVTDFLNEFKRLCRYLPHAEVDSKGHKKTPTTIAIANFLEKNGYSVGIVTRGHGRENISNSFLLKNQSWRECGDEVVLLKNNTSSNTRIFVSLNKVYAARQLSKMGCNIVLLLSLIHI